MEKRDINGHIIQSKYDCFSYMKYTKNVILTEDGKVILCADTDEQINSILQELLHNAEQGDAIAQYCYATHVASQENINQEESLKWALESAKNGYVLGAFKVAELYFNGIYGELSLEKAKSETMSLINKAAKDELPSACMFLVKILETLPNVEQYIISYTAAAARGNHPVAQVQLANMYLTGNSYLKEDWMEARKWFQKAAQNGNLEAKDWCLENNINIVSQSDAVVERLREIYNRKANQLYIANKK